MDRAAKPTPSDGGSAPAPNEDREPLGWDGVATIVILLVSVSRAGRSVSESSLGVLALRVFWVLSYLAIAMRLARQFGARWATWTIRRQPELCILLAVSFASCLWSLAPLVTMQKATSLLGTTTLGVFIGYALAPRRFIRALHWTFALLILSSVVVGLLGPTPVAQGMKLGWPGITGHPNTLGAAAVSATIFFLVLTPTRRVHPLWGAALSALCLFVLAQTRSRTSYAALGVSLLAYLYLAVAWTKRRPIGRTWRRVSLALVLGVAVIPFLLAPLAALLGKYDPLNGRIRLWDGALAILRERPLTGYGYAVVWGRNEATLLPQVAVTAHRSARNAHNGIMNVMSELGLPAAVVACVYLFRGLSDAARLFDRERSPFSFFALVFLVGFAVMSFTEAHLLQIHWFFWIAFVALTVAVKRALENPAARVATER